MPKPALAQPALTTVAISPRQIGEEAARLLLERIAAPDAAARQVILHPKLIVRRVVRRGVDDVIVTGDRVSDCEMPTFFSPRHLLTEKDGVRPMRNERSLGWGLIGASDIARTRMIEAIRAQPNSDVVAVMSSQLDRAQSYAAETNYSACLRLARRDLI